MGFIQDRFLTVIRDLFILHRNAQVLLHVSLVPDNPLVADEPISAFLTALAAFTEEIQAGRIDTIYLNEIKFVYKHGKNSLLYVIEVDKDDANDYVVEILRKIRHSFEEYFGGDLRDGVPEGMNFESFGDSAREIIQLVK